MYRGQIAAFSRRPGRSPRTRPTLIGPARWLLAAWLCIASAPLHAEPTPVTLWTDQADALGGGNANWHSLAIMHMAMHDALNAATPTYSRWSAPGPDEPQAEGASPQAALETAAATVLEGLHPNHAGPLAALLDARLASMPPGPARDRGVLVGAAVGHATLARRADDGFRDAFPFEASREPGSWRPTPPRYVTSNTTLTQPFLFDRRDSVPGLPPPALGSDQYRREVEATRFVGGAISLARTPAQADEAIFWAYQSTQRGFVHLAATLVDAAPSSFGLPEQARFMSQVTAAMADSAILIWAAKQHWAFWRPVDAIRSGAFGVPADPDWTSFIETPQHPEYPSGHAADCFTGAGMLQGVLHLAGPVTYTAQSAAAATDRPAEVWSSDMGDPPPPVELRPMPRVYATLEEAARRCADSRVWAGAHFPSANEESRRIATIIVARARSALPPLAR